eukprot:336020-Amorphochlora_amoeboformis.AAC.2
MGSGVVERGGGLGFRRGECGLERDRVVKPSGRRVPPRGLERERDFFIFLSRAAAAAMVARRDLPRRLLRIATT